jgi:hypothetical protein
MYKTLHNRTIFALQEVKVCKILQDFALQARFKISNAKVLRLLEKKPSETC